MIKPPVGPNARYVTPKEKAAARAQRLRFFYWLAVALPIVVTLMFFGYSDKAPAGLRALTENVDGAFGYPVLRLIALIAG